MMNKRNVLVSVTVITYNSSKTIIETLDSIFNQTYQDIELIVSDDCSADDTVKLCQEWIKSHKGRFVRTELLTVEKNTGIASNCNRAATACGGEWKKEIAGDDVMLPNCIQDCVDYVNEHPDTIWLFGKVDAFGSSVEENQRVNSCFNYSFFQMSQEEQLHYLVFEGNCIPAPAAFVHIKRNLRLGIENDERIPLMEDWPKWINLLRAGVKFHFIDKTIVRYRIGGISTKTELKPKSFYSQRLFYYLYLFPDRYNENPQKTIDEIMMCECDLFQQFYNRSQSKPYLLGRWILHPIDMIKQYICKK